MKAFVLARLKLAPAILGLVFFYLQAYQVNNPSQWVSVAIAVLTVLGIHATPNITKS